MTEEECTTTALIPVYERLIGNKKCLAVEARMLHEKLGVKKPFTQWLEQYTNKDDWRKDNDFSVFNLVVKNPDGGGRPGIDAALSLQMAEHIAMMTRTAKGREIREYFREARDQRDAAAMAEDPVERYPQLRAIRELITATATAQLTAERAEAHAQAAQDQAKRAEDKAAEAEKMAREAVSATGRMTLEEFILGNKLLAQFPGKLDRNGRRSWPTEVARLKNYCQAYGWEIIPVTVYGKGWSTENQYPIQALAWLCRNPTTVTQLGLVTAFPASIDAQEDTR
jgi:phage anti-repressor protein